MKTLIIVFSMILITFTQWVAAEEKETFLADYQLVLQDAVTLNQYVSKDGNFYHTSIDYEKIKNNSKTTSLINTQLKKLKSVEVPEVHNEKFAFWINAYNFFTIVEVINNYPVSSMKKIGWKNRHHDVGGKLYSLDDIEYKMLVPLADPRVHFAINCASVGCPSLANKIYTSNDLNKQLDSAVVNALMNPLHFRRIGNETLYITKIFHWFKKDFENSVYKGPEGFIHTFASERLKGVSRIMTEIEYDWNLNTNDNVQKKMNEFVDIKFVK